MILTKESLFISLEPRKVCRRVRYSIYMKNMRGAAGGDLLLFIFFLIILGIVWGLTGGPGRSISLEGPFLNPPFPLGDGSAYNVPFVSIPSSSEISGSNEKESSG